MGQDWVPVRVRGGVPAVRLRALVTAQARAYADLRQAGAEADLRTLSAAFGRVSDQLLDLLEPERVELDGALVWRTHRVGVIGDNPHFPPEWRDAAYATLLPEQVAPVVRRWRWWYAEIGAGGMRHYQARLAAREAGAELKVRQAELTDVAAATLGRTNAWARKERLALARQGMLGLPAVPPPPEVGAPPAAAADDAPTPRQDVQIAAVVRHAARLRQATRTFNAAVPGPFKCQLPPPAETWLVTANPVRDAWLERFFEWLDQTVHSGQGRYLWC